MKKTLIILILVFYNYAAYGCRNLTKEETIAVRKNNLVMMEKLTLEAYEKSDLVFEGVLSDLKKNKESDQTLYYPQFTSIKVLKGELSNIDSIFWAIKKDDFTWGCRQHHFFYESFSNEINDKYLVYVKSGKILRAGSFMEPSHQVSAAQELKWIQK